MSSCPNRRAEQSEDLAGCNLQLAAFYRDGLIVAFADVVDFDDRHSFLRPG